MTHHAGPTPPPETPQAPPPESPPVAWPPASAPPPAPATPPAATSPAPPAKGRGRRRLLGVGILLAFILVYALTLFGFHLLAKSAEPPKPPDLNATDDTIVLVRLE